MKRKEQAVQLLSKIDYLSTSEVALALRVKEDEAEELLIKLWLAGQVNRTSALANTWQITRMYPIH